MRSTRMITIGLAAVVALAIAPAWAAADPSPLTDTNFTAGTTGPDTWVVEPSSVRPKPTSPTSITDNFDVLGPPWTATLWGAGGTAAASGGSLTVDGYHVDDGTPTPTFTAPQTLVFQATFGDCRRSRSPHSRTWALAIRSTPRPGQCSAPAAAAWVTAPTFRWGSTHAHAMRRETNTPIGVDPRVPHVYRIEWSTTSDVKFYVDGTLVPTPAAVVPDPMRPVISDFSGDDGTNVKVDWLAMGSFPAAPTFISRVLQADDARTVWGNLTATGNLGTATIQTRSGNTATPDATWSDFQSVGASGAVQSPERALHPVPRDLRFRRENLASVSIRTRSTTFPDAAIAGVQVSGTSATATFGSPPRTSPSSNEASTVGRPQRAPFTAVSAWPPARTRSRCAPSTAPETSATPPGRRSGSRARPPGRGRPRRPLRLPPPTRRHRR